MTENSLLFVEDSVIAGKKDGKRVFGDYHLCRKNENYTDFILCDGIGSGIRASIAARMCARRIETLLVSGMSLRKVLAKIAATMHGIRSRDIPYAAFIVVRILNNGNFSVVGFEIPRPVILYENGAGAVEQHFLTMGGEVVFECGGILKQGESLAVCSDGITQAGMGRGLPMGLTDDGLLDFLDKAIQSGTDHKKAVQAAYDHAIELSGGLVDDMSMAVLSCRPAVEMDIITGPPALKNLDTGFVERFMKGNGKKAVCGSSTLDMVSRFLDENITTIPGKSFAQPPRYAVKGIDIAAEGAVTLNQLFNIIDEDPEDFDEESVVTDLCRSLVKADVIRFHIGDAVNTGHESIVFRQTGILPRKVIIPMIIDKLTDLGKIVTIIRP